MKTKLLVVLIIFLGSCGRKTDESSSIKVINMLSRPESEITYLSDISTDVEYIPLQTSENSVIKYINNLKICDNKIYIPVNKEILCFDKTGRYLYKLSKEGRGPSEYTSIYNYYIDINSDGDLFILLTFGKLLIYKISVNEFLFYKSLDFITDLNNVPSNLDFMPLQNNILISYAPSGGELFRNVIINLDGDTLVTRKNFYHYKENQKFGFAGAYTNINFKYNNSLHFKELFNDTVFILDQSNHIRPYLVLDCHKKQVTPDILENLSPDHKSDLTACFRILNIMEVSRYLVCLLRFNHPEYYEIYDKTLNKKFRFAEQAFLQDDITGGANFEPKICENGNFYSWIDVLNLKKIVSSDNFQNKVVKHPEKKKALKELADSLKDTDNPVLIVVTPRE